MRSTSNTTGFTQDELDVINAVFVRLMVDNKGLEDYSINDAINNAWRSGISEEELYAAAAKRLGLDHV